MLLFSFCKGDLDLSIIAFLQSIDTFCSNMSFGVIIRVESDAFQVGMEYLVKVMLSVFLSFHSFHVSNRYSKGSRIGLRLCMSNCEKLKAKLKDGRMPKIIIRT